MSPQSRVIEARRALEMKFDELLKKFGDGEIPVPSFWGGYRVVPRAIEFWQGGSNRLHDRLSTTVRIRTGRSTTSRPDTRAGVYCAREILMLTRVIVLSVCVLAAACGGSSTPTSPSTSSGSSAPTNFVIATQQVTMTSNVVGFTWSGSGSTYKMIIGSAAGASDILSADVTGTSYTWTGPRTAGIYYARVAATTSGTVGSASTELPVFTLDMRNMIDALFFGYGPMSDAGSNGPASSAAVWADGATINTLVTTEAGAASLTAAQTFVQDYLAATSNFISAPISTTTTGYGGVSLFAISDSTPLLFAWIGRSARNRASSRVTTGRCRMDRGARSSI